MGKLGGIILLAILALTGSAAHAAPTDPAEDFVTAVRSSGSSYANLSAPTLKAMGRELCEHFDGGFTTEDLRKSDGERLAIVGEIARTTICA